jgi:hypothetical protein
VTNEGVSDMKFLYVIKNAKGQYIDRDGSWTPELDRARIYPKQMTAHLRMIALKKKLKEYRNMEKEEKMMFLTELHVVKEVVIEKMDGSKP